MGLSIFTKCVRKQDEWESIATACQPEFSRRVHRHLFLRQNLSHSFTLTQGVQLQIQCKKTRAMFECCLCR